MSIATSSICFIATAEQVSKIVARISSICALIDGKAPIAIEPLSGIRYISHPLFHEGELLPASQWEREFNISEDSLPEGVSLYQKSQNYCNHFVLINFQYGFGFCTESCSGTAIEISLISRERFEITISRFDDRQVEQTTYATVCRDIIGNFGAGVIGSPPLLPVRQAEGYYGGYLYKDSWIIWESVSTLYISKPEFQRWENQEIGCHSGNPEVGNCVVFPGNAKGKELAEAYYRETSAKYDQLANAQN